MWLKYDATALIIRYPSYQTITPVCMDDSQINKKLRAKQSVLYLLCKY